MQLVFCIREFVRVPAPRRERVVISSNSPLGKRTKTAIFAAL
jgi:hypothetical protein